MASATDGPSPASQRAVQRIMIRALERRYPGTRWRALEDDGTDPVAAGAPTAETSTGQILGYASLAGLPEPDPPVDGLGRG